MQGLDVGVHLQLQGAQQALVHRDCCDASSYTSPAEATQTHAGAQAAPEAAAAAHPGKTGRADARTGSTRVRTAAEGPGAGGGHLVGLLGHPDGHGEVWSEGGEPKTEVQEQAESSC